jgi:hypothetical protein
MTRLAPPVDTRPTQAHYRGGVLFVIDDHWSAR